MDTPRPPSLAGRILQLALGPEGPAAPPAAPQPGHAGRPLVSQGRIRRRRTWAGDEAEVTVQPGDEVGPGHVIARLQRTGRTTALDAAAALGVPAGQVGASLLRQVGDMLAEGDLLAERRSLGGFQRRTMHSTASGRITYISPDHGTIFVEPAAVERQVLAHLSGRVVEATPSGVVIEGNALAVHGVAGAGRAAVGLLMLADAPHNLPPEASGAIVACAFPLDEPAVGALTEAGAAAVIAPGADEATLQRLGWDDFLWSPRARSDRWGPRATPPLTIVFLGVGPSEAPPRLWEVLRPLAGRPASALGAEPGAPSELLIGLDDGSSGAPPPAPLLAPGAAVRLIAGRAEGQMGKVVAVRRGVFRLASEIGTEVVEVAFPDGAQLHVPAVHVQLLP
jgi:hypothetical protein